MNPMNPLLSAMSHYVGFPQHGRGRPAHSRSGRIRKARRQALCVEPLEARSLLSVAISIGDASAIEGSSTLKFIDRFVSEGSGGLARPRSSIFGPDGNLYVVSADTNAVLRYDGVTGAFIDTFVTSGSGGLTGPSDLVFGLDGNLYVSSNVSYVTGVVGTQVLRYDGSSGAFLNVVASGLASPLGLTFGSDGSLYIANEGKNQVLREDNSGLRVFVSAGSGGLNQPRKAVFGPDGNLYVASQGTGQILRYNGLTGAFIDTFANTNIGQGLTQGPIWLEFGTDGYLYTTARYPTNTNTSILRFNAATGAFVDAFVLNRDGWSFNLGPGNVVYDSGNSSGNFVDRYGPSSLAAFTVSLGSASPIPVTIDYSTADGTALAGRDYIAASGTLTFAPGLTAQTILIQTVDDGVADPAKSFTINLSNAVGAIIARAQGTGTILDGDTTKFYVDDASTYCTYRYGVSGNAFGNSTLDSGNTAPRGAASNAAGTTVWVADVNKNVYVYDPSGALLGSWAAGGLPTNAQVQGIATDGTDIWLLDNYTATVYKYTGAAGLLSGTQSADSSFPLDNANTNPKGIVTDGTSFWIVDAGTSGKVFKYTLTGSLLGSWTIDPANTQPTGITIDPNNVSDIWIVDNGTLQVYQYTAAADLTSGSQIASAIFGLAPGDTNPQGIADPPPSDMLLTPAACPLALNQAAVAAFHATASGEPSAVAGVPSLARRETVFALLVRESLPRPGEFSVDLMAGGALPPHLDSPTPVADRAWTRAGASGEQKPSDPLPPIALGSRHWFRPERSAVGLLDRAWIDEESQASALDSIV